MRKLWKTYMNIIFTTTRNMNTRASSVLWTTSKLMTIFWMENKTLCKQVPPTGKTAKWLTSLDVVGHKWQCDDNIKRRLRIYSNRSLMNSYLFWFYLFRCIYPELECDIRVTEKKVIRKYKTPQVKHRHNKTMDSIRHRAPVIRNA